MLTIQWRTSVTGNGNLLCRPTNLQCGLRKLYDIVATVILQSACMQNVVQHAAAGHRRHLALP